MSKQLKVALVFGFDLRYRRRVLRGIKKYAQSRPRWLLTLNKAEEFTEQALQTVSPVGVIATVYNRKVLRVLQSATQPVVNVTPVLPRISFPTVMVNYREAGHLAFDHLRDRGVRHFNFVGHSQHMYSTNLESSFRTAVAGTGGSYDHFFESPPKSFNRSAALLGLNPELHAWLRALPKPAGVFTCTDWWGGQVLEACRLTGLRVPEDVAVISSGNDDVLCELTSPPLSSIDVAAEDIGYAAAALLARLMRGEGCSDRLIEIPPIRVVPRQSSNLWAIEDGDVAAVLRFIHDHAHEPLNVTDVLREVPLSRRGLEQRFRRAVQRTLGEEIRRVHVRHAKDLLAGTDLSVALVAHHAGFSNATHLSVVFRQETGMTPTSYRRQFRGAEEPAWY